MSDRIVIEAESREVVRKRVGQLRREGMVPGVIYGKGDPQSIQMEQRSLRRALRVVGTANLVDIDVDGSVRPVLVREIQQHLTRGDVLHVDFFEVDMLNTIRMEVELIMVGESAPQTDGLGVVTMPMRSVEIEALPDALVSHLDVDVSKIATPDDQIVIGDLVVPKGVTILADPDLVIARFEYDTLAEEEEEEEGLEDEFGATAEDVEVITKGKQEEEDF